MNNVKRFARSRLVLPTALAAVPAAPAKDGDVRRAGRCTGASTAKIKLSEENGRIEIEFEVDQNRVGVRWNMVLRGNGTVIRRASRVTRAERGPSSCGHWTANRTGAERITATATRAGSAVARPRRSSLQDCGMRTYVRCRWASRRSCTPISTPSTRRTSSATTRSSAAGLADRGGGVVLAASYEAKAYGIVTAMGGASARRLCLGPSSSHHGLRLRRGEQGRLRGLRPGRRRSSRRLDRRGVPRRPRLRTAGRHADRDGAAWLREAVLEEVGLPITVGVARRSSSPRWQAASRSRTGSWSCRRRVS